jgi:hypothetical protein
MRQDQFERLQALTEKLTDALIQEMDPEAWPGAGILPASMDQQTRGDRYWCKKNAAATLTLIMKNTSLIDVARRQTAGGGGSTSVEEADSSLDAELRAAEKEAEECLKKIQAAAR